MLQIIKLKYFIKNMIKHAREKSERASMYVQK